MKKHLLLGVSLVALGAASPAIAAPRAPVMPAAPVYNWTGWYAGGNIGYSWGNADSTYTDHGFAPPTSFSGSEQLDGIIGGAQVGYNWQIGNWVYGLETDFQGSGEK